MVDNVRRCPLAVRALLDALDGIALHLASSAITTETVVVGLDNVGVLLRLLNVVSCVALCCCCGCEGSYLLL